MDGLSRNSGLIKGTFDETSSDPTEPAYGTERRRESHGGFMSSVGQAMKSAEPLQESIRSQNEQERFWGILTVALPLVLPKERTCSHEALWKSVVRHSLMSGLEICRGCVPQHRVATKHRPETCRTARLLIAERYCILQGRHPFQFRTDYLCPPFGIRGTTQILPYGTLVMFLLHH